MKNLNKKSLRQLMFLTRSNLTASDVKSMSDKIESHLLNIPQVKKLKNILLYIHINNEVETENVINHLISNKKTIILPKHIKNNWHLSKFESWDKLEKGPYNIPQPSGNNKVNPKIVELAILPGVAYDLAGTRLGYGLGVFDKLLASSNCLKIGLAYDFQIVKNLPKENHDLTVDYVVTEEKIYRITPN